MAYVKKRKANRIRRRPYKKARRGYKKGGKTTLVNRALQPIAQRYICRMKYCQNITGSTLGLGVYRLNLNSIYDPDRTGTGHQPYGHDTFQTMYNRYRVFGCRYSITVSSGNATSYISVAAVPSNEQVTASSGTISEIREQPRCRYAVQAPGAALRTIKGYVSLPSLMGRTKMQYKADDRYQAQFGASPAELAILNIFFQNMDETTVTIPYSVTVTLIYYVELFDGITLAQS